jgi:hypothetical protein
LRNEMSRALQQRIYPSMGGSRTARTKNQRWFAA